MIAPKPIARSANSRLRLERVVTHFQPILSARQKSIIGLEALSRGITAEGDMLAAPAMFAMARSAGVADDTEHRCRREAVHRFSTLAHRASDLVLFLNVSASGALDPEAIAADLKALVVSSNLTPSSVAVEIPEAEIEDMTHLEALNGLLRREGFLIALDDMGAGHCNLDRIPLIKPDLLKIDRALVAAIDSDYYRRGAFKSLVDLSRKIGALVIAEGIETEDEALVSLELGADLLQGYWLGGPDHYESAREPGLTASCDRIEDLAMRFRSYRARTIHDRKVRHDYFNRVMDQILEDLTTVEACEYSDVLTETIARYPQVECMYVLDHLGVQVTETVCQPATRLRADGALFRPARKGADHSLKEYYYIPSDTDLQRYTTDPYVSLATGSISQTVSFRFRDARSDDPYVLCIDVLCD